MKIVYFTDMFFPQINGVITSLATIASALAKNGHEIYIFIPRPGRHQKVNWSAPGVKIETLPSLPGLFYPDLRAASPISFNLLTKLRKIDPDILHFQTQFLVGGGSIFLGKLLRKPILGSFHGYIMEPEYLKLAKVDHIKGLPTILWTYSKWFYDQCDGVLTFAESVKRDLVAHKIKRPIQVIPNTISESCTQKLPDKKVAELKQTLNLKKNVILYVGRVSPEKSLDVLVDSFSKVIQKQPDTSLLIIGDGPCRKSLEEQVLKLGLTNNVVFTGILSTEKLLTGGYYQLADLFATASTSEVQPVSIIEAMYFELPIVGVNKRGVGDMIRDCGLLAKPGNTNQLAQHMLDVINKPSLKTTLSNKSQKKYEAVYSLDKVVKAYEEYYKTFIPENEPRRGSLSARIFRKLTFR
ncbi:MAG TPA: glycosyltransferase [Patescibacteria group bacterium]|nr:glycosyltransferase [Patescibacteria group bacterium]